MTDVLFEQHLVQNPGLGAEAIWQAIHAAYEESSRTKGVPLALAFVILPLVFHKRSAESISTRARPGALYKAIAGDREITVGLQERMESLSDRTLESLSIAFSTGILRIDTDHYLELTPGRQSLPIQHVTNEVSTILKASKRIGQAFAELSETQLITYLSIQF